MELRLGWRGAAAPGYNYKKNQWIWEVSFMEWHEFGNKIELGLRLLRAVAQSYNYNYNYKYNKIESGCNFQMN